MTDSTIESDLSQEVVPLGSNYGITYPPPQKYPNAVVYRFALQSAARDLLPGNRIGVCLRCRVKPESVDLLHVPETKSAHYGNLMVCGSVWVCAVCASKITEYRRIEIQEVVDQHLATGGSVALATFTMQHNEFESLEAILDGLQAASQSFWAGSPIQRIKVRFGIEARIRALEITHGKNGWHPHFHVLLFFEKGMTPELMYDLEHRCRDRWLTRLEKNGRYANWENGFTLRWGDNAVAEYLAKMDKELNEEFKQWTEAHELAKSVSKTARQGGRTPNALLADYLQGDKQAGHLWREYSKAIKGKKPIVWSRGLRERYGMELEKSDEQVVTEQNETAVLLAQFDSEQWKAILAHDIRGELLMVAKFGDAWLVLDFLEDFGITGVYYPTLLDDPHYSGDFRSWDVLDPSRSVAGIDSKPVMSGLWSEPIQIKRTPLDESGVL